jgi:Asp/Glu/hydantoin racemase
LTRAGARWRHRRDGIATIREPIDHGRLPVRRGVRVIARGGKALYGAPLGILMLEARFPRVPGDMGNATTWPFPVLYKVIAGASPDRVVRRRAEGLLEDFVAGAKELVALGAEAITTNCGFLSLFQAELAARLDVPVATSSLLQVPLVERLLPPGRRAGIITVDSRSLSEAHLAAAGCAPDTPRIGTEEGRELTRVLLGNEERLDTSLAEADMLAAGEALLRRHPEIGAIVLECTNMGPYAASLQRRLGLPVHDIVSFITWFHAGLRPRRFESP